MFNPQRLSVARKRRAMSKKGLAESISVSTNTIHRYEAGAGHPSDETVGFLAQALGFPETFFYGPDIDQPRRDNASFRGLASKTDKVMDAALQSGTLAYMFDDWITTKFQRIELDLPEYPAEMPPQVAARLLRDHWRLGDKPIKNMVHLMERKGIRVFSLAENNQDIDAFSVWRNDIPYVFLNRFKSAERSRFDAAHELCHLCLHKHGGAAAELKNSPIEKDAQSFAGAFLMPEDDLRSIVTTNIFSVEDLLPYKKRWRVAASALLYRLLELGIIKESRKNSLYVDMSRKNWIRSEPQGITREQSEFWQFAFDDLREQGISKIDISNETGVPIEELDSLVFGLANMITINGLGNLSPKRKDHLRVVK